MNINVNMTMNKIIEIIISIRKKSRIDINIFLRKKMNLLNLVMQKMKKMIMIIIIRIIIEIIIIEI